MGEIVNIEMTREHAEAVQNACELLMRLKLGQPGYMTDLLLGWPKGPDDMSSEEYILRRDLANEILKTALKVLYGENNYGEPDCEKDMLEALSYEVWSTIRYALAWHDHPEGSDWNVSFRQPLSESGLTMPKCQVTKTRRNIGG